MEDTLNIRIHGRLKGALEKLAESKFTSVATIARMAIAEKLEREGIELDTVTAEDAASDGAAAQ